MEEEIPYGKYDVPGENIDITGVKIQPASISTPILLIIKLEFSLEGTSLRYI